MGVFMGERRWKRIGLFAAAVIFVVGILGSVVPESVYYETFRYHLKEYGQKRLAFSYFPVFCLIRTGFLYLLLLFSVWKQKKGAAFLGLGLELLALSGYAMLLFGALGLEAVVCRTPAWILSETCYLEGGAVCLGPFPNDKQRLREKTERSGNESDKKTRILKMIRVSICFFAGSVAEFLLI